MEDFNPKFEQPNTQPNTQADEYKNEQIITKLNLYFNYIINNNGVSNFENMQPVDKDCIISVLKRLDLYIDDVKILKMLPDYQYFNYKMQYWCIHEIYFSPYKLFLNTMTRKQFLFRYFKAQKYGDLNHLNYEEFVKYFMRCIQEEMEASNKINDRKSKRNGGNKSC